MDGRTDATSRHLSAGEYTLPDGSILIVLCRGAVIYRPSVGGILIRPKSDGSVVLRVDDAAKSG